MTSFRFLSAFIFAGAIAGLTPGQASAAEILTAGVIKGGAGVNQIGGATYSIPLDLPVGAAGLQPQLSLNYSSQSGYGYLGNGWGVGGLGAITRCSSVKALDQEYNPITLTEKDYLCFNGKRLIDKSQVNNHIGWNHHLGEYRLEIDDFSLIEARGADGSATGNGAADRFTLKTKDGRTLYFGYTADSRQMGLEPVTGTQTTLAWYLNKVEDRFGNYYTINYFQDSGSAQGAIYPSSIYFTGKNGGVSPKYKIEFEYLDINSTFKKTSYLVWAQINTTRRLNKIKVYELGTPTQGGTENRIFIRHYKFDYAENSLDNTFNMSQVQECGYNYGTANYLCKSPTTFEYTTSANYDVCYNGAVKAPISASESLDDFEQFFSDINADGRADIVLVKTTATGFKLATATSQFPVSDSADSPCKSMSGNGYPSSVTISSFDASTSYSGAKVLAGDINGDRKEDLVFISSDLTIRSLVSNANGYFQDLLSPSTASDTGPADSQKFLADFDGDKILDVAAVSTITSTSNSTHLARISIRFGDGTGGFSSPTVWEAQIVGASVSVPADAISRYEVGDFNGDGRLDFAAMRVGKPGTPCLLPAKNVLPADRANLFTNSLSPSNGESVTGIPADVSALVVDRNRDGLSDIVGIRPFSSGLGATTFVSLYQGGKGTGYVTPYGDITISYVSSWDRFASSDFNGDGEPDLFYLTIKPNASDSSLFQLHVMPSYGYGGDKYKSGTGKFVLKAGDSITTTQNSTYTPDVNADGLTDIVSIVKVSGGLEVFSAVTKAEYPNLLKKVTDGHGVQTWINYGVTTNSLVHETKPVASGQVAITAPLYVVKQVVADQGGSNTTAVSYKYEGATADLSGRNFLGYQKILVTDSLGVVTATTYELAFPYTGMVKSVTKSRNNVLLYELTSSFDNSYLSWPTNRQQSYPEKRVYFPFVEQATSKTYVIKSDMSSSTLVNQTVVDVVYDAYGNPTSQIESITGNGKLQRNELTQTFHTADESKWRIGDLNRRIERRISYDGATQAATVLSDVTRTIERSDYDLVTGFLKREIVEPDASQYRVQYDYVADAFGHIKDVTVSGADITTRTSSRIYDSTGRYLQTITNALGQSTTQTMDSRFGLIDSVTDPNLLVTSTTYDELGRAKLQSRPDGTTTQIEYLRCDSTITPTSDVCATGEKFLVRSTTTGVSPVRVYYDRLGREVRRFTTLMGGVNSTVSTEYDSKGRLSRTSLPYAAGPSPDVRWTVTAYDDIGRISTVTQPGNRQTTTTVNGFTTSIKNPRNYSRIEERNALGQLVKVTDAKNGELSYRYDAFGNLTGTTDAAGNQTTLTIDRLGRKTQQIDPDMGTWGYTYSVLGELKTQTDGRGFETSFNYDLLGRLKDKLNPDLNAHWEYDSALGKGVGQLKRTWTDNSFERSYEYDDFGRVKFARVTPSGGATTYEHQTTYYSSGNDKGKPWKVIYPNGGGYQNVYDASTGVLKKVQSLDGATTYWEAQVVDVAGRVTQAVLGNGLTTKRSYDANSGLISTIQTGSTTGSFFNSNVQNDSYYFDAVGNLQLRMEAVNNVVEDFQYDELDRLTTINPWDGSPGVTVAYDSIGNITSKSDVGSYTYSGANCGSGAHRVCSISGAVNTTFTYDANGNTKTGNGRTYLNDQAAQGWTKFNKPFQIVGSGATDTFVYDSDYERIKRTTTRLVNGVSQDTVLLTINPRLDLGGTYEVETRPDTTVATTWHIYAGREPVGAVEKIGSQSSVRYFHTDHLGSIKAVTNASQQVLESLSYDAWGRRRNVGPDMATYNLVWANALGTAPTTANPNSVGITMPASMRDNLITWKSPGLLAFDISTRKKSDVAINGQNQVDANSNLRLRMTLAMPAQLSTRRYINAGLVNTGTGSALRRFTALVRGGTLYVQRCTPACVEDAIGSVTNGQTYNLEISTTARTAVLNFYPFGGARADGYVFSDFVDWSANNTAGIKKQLWAQSSAKPVWLPVGGVIPVKARSNAINLDNPDIYSFIPAPAIVATSTRHGFTGHEMLDSQELVHMNGRIYDPVIGRFLSADPNVFYPENMQDFNRYSYVHNNPLSFTDPSGYFLEEIFEDDLADAVSIGFGDAYDYVRGFFGAPAQPVTSVNGGGNRSPVQSNVTVKAEGGALYSEPAKTTITQPLIISNQDVNKGGASNRNLYQSTGNYAAGINAALSFGLSDIFWDVLGYDTSYRNSNEYNAGLLTGASLLLWLGPESLAINGTNRGAPVAFEMADAAITGAAARGDHIVLGLTNFGLESTAAQVGGRTLLNDPHWMATLQKAIANPATKFTVSLDGMAGSSVYSQVMGAAQRGAARGASYTDWEMSQLFQAGRLGDVSFLQAGKSVPNPF